MSQDKDKKSKIIEHGGINCKRSRNGKFFINDEKEDEKEEKKQELMTIIGIGDWGFSVFGI